MTFSPEQLRALRTLVRLWSAERFVLIGASALSCHMEMRWRQTRDLDFVLEAAIREYPAGLDKEPGWERHPRLEQRWIGPGDVSVDVIPLGDLTSGESQMEWPESGFVMSRLGLRLAFEHALAVELPDGLTIRAAPVEVVALLKMISYLDRPHERERDLQDIAYILEEYVSASDDRRYADDILDLGLPYDDVSAYLLGNRVSRMVNESEREAVLTFVEKVRKTNDQAATQARMLAVGPSLWRHDPDELLGRFAAFERGFTMQKP